MPDPRKAFADWQADYKAELRTAWEESGTTATFDEWKAERDAAERAEQHARVVAEERAENLARSLRALDKQIPARYRDAATTEPNLLAWVDDLQRRGTDLGGDGRAHGPSLLLLGPTGVGKTHAAFGALRHFVTAGGNGYLRVVTAADLYAQLRPRPGRDSEELFEQYASTNLLFLDDLGAAKSSEWVEEINYRLINHRYNHELATIITSNVPPKELGGVLGERVASRLTEMCGFVVLKGQDRRRTAA